MIIFCEPSNEDTTNRPYTLFKAKSFEGCSLTIVSDNGKQSLGRNGGKNLKKGKSNGSCLIEILSNKYTTDHERQGKKKKIKIYGG